MYLFLHCEKNGDMNQGQKRKLKVDPMAAKIDPKYDSNRQNLLMAVWLNLLGVKYVNVFCVFHVLAVRCVDVEIWKPCRIISKLKCNSNEDNCWPPKWPLALPLNRPSCTFFHRLNCCLNRWHLVNHCLLYLCSHYYHHKQFKQTPMASPIPSTAKSILSSVAFKIWLCLDCRGGCFLTRWKWHYFYPLE